MGKLNTPSGFGFLSTLTAGAASLCCIPPILALFAGSSSVLSLGGFLSAYRPYLLVVASGLLLLAWLPYLKTKSREDCACPPEEKPSWWRSKKWLWINTSIVGLFMVLPYAQGFPSGGNSNVLAAADSTRTAVVQVKGMTCAGCEAGIERALTDLPGLYAAEASFAQASATFAYNPAVLKRDQIEAAISALGYEVQETPSLTPAENASYFEVKLGCRAVAGLGCGSLAKPVLRTLDALSPVAAASINKSGTLIQVGWEAGTDIKEAQSLVLRKLERMGRPSRLKEGNAQLTNTELWLGAEAVYLLSEEEAGVFARRLLPAYTQGGSLNKAEERQVKATITRHFTAFFSADHSPQSLTDPARYEQLFQAINEEVRGLSLPVTLPNMDQLMKLCGSGTSCATAAPSCGSGSSCCTPRK